MAAKQESFSRSESDFDKLRRTREVDGWRYLGREGLTETKLSKEAKFEDVPYQTEDEIKARYLEKAKQQDSAAEFEIELVLDEGIEKLARLKGIVPGEEYRNILKNLNQGDRNYFVFVRRIK